MSGIPTLETERLVLRPFTPDDAGDVQRLAGDRSIADTTLSIPHPYGEGLAAEWISTHQKAFDEGTGMTFAVTRRSDGALVGAIGLMGMTPGHQAELGYWIGRPYWNQGFSTEAGEAVLRYAFSELGLIRIHACHFTRNPASGRVMQKLGMQYEGCRRQHIKKWDSFEDVELYGILKGGWTQDLEAHLRELEESHLRYEVRSSPDSMRALLAEDFLEFGSSGRVIDRETAIASLSDQGAFQSRVDDFAVRSLAPVVALTTYRLSVWSESQSQARVTLRSSVWVYRTDEWVLVFHQGTLAHRE